MTELSNVSELLNYLERFKTLSADEQQRTLALVGKLAEKPRTPEKIRLAVLLSLPDTSFADNERARLLLADYIQARKAGGSDEPLRQFAQFMLQILEQREESGEKIELLEQQLEQLKTIEKDLNDRKAATEPIDIAQ